MDVLSHSSVNGSDHVQMIQLPPISSFDSLIRAASVTDNNSITSSNSNFNAGTPSPGVTNGQVQFTVGSGTVNIAPRTSRTSVPNSLMASTLVSVSPRASASVNAAYTNANTPSTHHNGNYNADHAESFSSSVSFNDNNNNNIQHNQHHHHNLQQQLQQHQRHPQQIQRQESNNHSVPVVVSSGKTFTDSLMSYQFGSTGSSGSSPNGQQYRPSSYFQSSLSNGNGSHTQSPFAGNPVSQPHHQIIPKLNSGISNMNSLMDQQTSPTSDNNNSNVHHQQLHTHYGQGHGSSCNHTHSHSQGSLHHMISPISTTNNHATSPTNSIATVLSPTTSTPSSTVSSTSKLSSLSTSSDLNTHLMDNSKSAKMKIENNANMVSKKQPRKKKQCPLCGLFFSNLSTHKSTHLSPETRPFKCEVCSRGFARSNDLIRHKKLHWKDDLNQESMDFVEKLKCLHELKGTYKCPFNSNLINLDLKLKGSDMKTADLPFETSNCHSTGVFSRCDTFKNHLKALHFEYPPGTKKKDRANVAGHCKHCGQKFESIETWLKDHVGKECGYNYTG
ncbi:uncharacterized protein KLLA0_F07073g [Kluyveromyces lactis]|uniref:KLLA0F07073p n=1 Tax=Kluyveromyces lactis (strain ATCC 8585 / CBS 2359 / DSM 70799 / NBRC 1267 / NRRL Y-1140 / WM37) TaxID=284590 RepID=Q6CKY8_KLULA|nr:uncharacterized protein KLLA0_F07073g [Kluyveromyces lactis]CAG98109.1 KLLA0F07073p [Kluyveromyces lactis]|eukprot:XP_455401.1 uncharacterized protein KLLA0_F07073g [Kluyveromyces lactis]